MHRNVTPNSLNEFASEILTFLRHTVPKKWHEFRDQVTDNFRSFNPEDFRVIT